MSRTDGDSADRLPLLDRMTAEQREEYLRLIHVHVPGRNRWPSRKTITIEDPEVRIQNFRFRKTRRSGHVSMEIYTLQQPDTETSFQSIESLLEMESPGIFRLTRTTVIEQGHPREGTVTEVHGGASYECTDTRDSRTRIINWTTGIMLEKSDKVSREDSFEDRSGITPRHTSQQNLEPEELLLALRLERQRIDSILAKLPAPAQHR